MFDPEQEDYLSEFDLEFLKNLSRNEALLEYYHHICEGLVCIFTQSKIITGKFEVDGSTNASKALELAGECIP